MKNISLFLIALLLFLLFLGTSQVYALTITGGIEVGGIDNIIARADLSNSGDTGESDWVQSVLGSDWTITYTTPYSSNDWVQTNQSGVYALELNTAPSYFFIKTGNLKLSPTNFEHFLYQNLASLDYAVINIADWNAGTANSINIGKVSHIGEIGSTPVPEPATMLLLGSGLVGLSGFGRRRFKKN